MNVSFDSIFFHLFELLTLGITLFANIDTALCRAHGTTSNSHFIRFVGDHPLTKENWDDWLSPGNAEEIRKYRRETNGSYPRLVDSGNAVPITLHYDDDKENSFERTVNIQCKAFGNKSTELFHVDDGICAEDCQSILNPYENKIFNPIMKYMKENDGWNFDEEYRESLSDVYYDQQPSAQKKPDYELDPDVLSDFVMVSSKGGLRVICCLDVMYNLLKLHDGLTVTPLKKDSILVDVLKKYDRIIRHIKSCHIRVGRSLPHNYDSSTFLFRNNKTNNPHVDVEPDRKFESCGSMGYLKAKRKDGFGVNKVKSLVKKFSLAAQAIGSTVTSMDDDILVLQDVGGLTVVSDWMYHQVQHAGLWVTDFLTLCTESI